MFILSHNPYSAPSVWAEHGDDKDVWWVRGGVLCSLSSGQEAEKQEGARGKTHHGLPSPPLMNAFNMGVKNFQNLLKHCHLLGRKSSWGNISCLNHKRSWQNQCAFTSWVYCDQHGRGCHIDRGFVFLRHAEPQSRGTSAGNVDFFALLLKGSTAVERGLHLPKVSDMPGSVWLTMSGSV